MREAIRLINQQVFYLRERLDENGKAIANYLANIEAMGSVNDDLQIEIAELEKALALIQSASAMDQSP